MTCRLCREKGIPEVGIYLSRDERVKEIPMRVCLKCLRTMIENDGRF